ncbi:hypothetical protein [Legionella spiritensis]|uniref:hypothetical protein n=1 Tax=Legionella spiritensis TaxID=452 RepID=UPI000F6D03FE|nr:hypothetical protein [Legionella spiritensis]VEG92092.1 Uncharacterised protein [Legionella spiritensis]
MEIILGTIYWALAAVFVWIVHNFFSILLLSLLIIIIMDIEQLLKETVKGMEVISSQLYGIEKKLNDIKNNYHNDEDRNDDLFE